jgi:DNA polymerase-3 subunit delta'
VPATHPDRAGDTRRAASTWSPESTLRRLEAVLSCREALEVNVKPRIAVEAMLTILYRG